MRKIKKATPGGPALSVREKAVWSLFWKAGFNVDIEIDKMYAVYNGLKSPVLFPFGSTQRTRQMSLGMVITIINRKLKGSRLAPGRLKRTYRLIHSD